MVVIFSCDIKNVNLGSSTPDLCIKCERYESDVNMQNQKFVRLNWVGDDRNKIGTFNCLWKLSVSDDVLIRKDVETIKEWTDGKVKTTGRIRFKKSGTRGFDLKIIGKGADNRCRWCKSFRKALSTKTNNEIERRGHCKFEK